MSDFSLPFSWRNVRFFSTLRLEKAQILLHFGVGKRSDSSLLFVFLVSRLLNLCVMSLLFGVHCYFIISFTCVFLFFSPRPETAKRQKLHHRPISSSSALSGFWSSQFCNKICLVTTAVCTAVVVTNRTMWNSGLIELKLPQILFSVVHSETVSLCVCADLMGLQHPGFLVHRADWSQHTVPQLVLWWSSSHILDDRILQRSGIPDRYETGMSWTIETGFCISAHWQLFQVLLGTAQVLWYCT